MIIYNGINVYPRMIIEHCNNRLGPHEVPRKVYFIDELPKNATGKILKRALRIQGEHERGIASGRAPVTTYY